MRAPQDCEWCRHLRNKEVCDTFKDGETCSITYSGDVWHKDEWEKMTKLMKSRYETKLKGRMKTWQD